MPSRVKWTKDESFCSPHQLKKRYIHELWAQTQDANRHLPWNMEVQSSAVLGLNPEVRKKTTAPKLEIAGICCLRPSRNSLADFVVPCTPTHMFDMWDMCKTNSCKPAPFLWMFSALGLQVHPSNDWSLLGNPYAPFSWTVRLLALRRSSGHFDNLSHFASRKTVPIATSSSIYTCSIPNHTSKLLQPVRQVTMVYIWVRRYPDSRVLHAYVNQDLQQPKTFPFQWKKEIECSSTIISHLPSPDSSVDVDQRISQQHNACSSDHRACDHLHDEAHQDTVHNNHNKFSTTHWWYPWNPIARNPRTTTPFN